MKKYKIVHISQTPLVDSPRKISDGLNFYTEDFQSISIIINDYPGKLSSLFNNRTLNYYKQNELCLRKISEADIIHIHNQIEEKVEQEIFSFSNDFVKFVYQVHSPLREGPLFFNYTPTKIKFDKKLVVGQYQPRFYEDFIIVPNLILENPSLNLIKENEKPKILFSPSHKRIGGRWNDKFSNELIDTLNSLKQLNKIELYLVENYSPFELYELRKNIHITIDEIVTGSFHQVSLEGLFCGNVVINNSDFFSDLALQNITYSEQEIPFFKANNKNVNERILNLCDNYKEIQKYQKASYEYAKNQLRVVNLIKHYTNVYKDILN